MGRPLYESQSDLQREVRAIQELSALGKKLPRKLPIRYGVDFAMMEGDRVACWVEVKCRNNPRHAYPTLMISLGKLVQGVHLWRETGKPFFLVVRWADALGWVQVKDLKKYNCAVGGRWDRADAQDVEPVCLIPVNDFKVLTVGAANGV